MIDDLIMRGAHAHLAGTQAFALFLAPLRKTKWFVSAKRAFAGPKAVLTYLACYTHRVVISNSRLTRANATTVQSKNYRVEGPARYTTMTLDTAEFIRRFLIYVLPKGFDRICVRALRWRHQDRVHRDGAQASRRARRQHLCQYRSH